MRINSEGLKPTIDAIKLVKQLQLLIKNQLFVVGNL